VLQRKCLYEVPAEADRHEAVTLAVKSSSTGLVIATVDYHSNTPSSLRCHGLLRK
jgi:hypothetical protein